jgi:hypothetical protein
VAKYLELLSAGGSESPPTLLRKLGVDIEDPAFWRLGLTLLPLPAGAPCPARAAGRGVQAARLRAARRAM